MDENTSMTIIISIVILSVAITAVTGIICGSSDDETKTRIDRLERRIESLEHQK